MASSASTRMNDVVTVLVAVGSSTVVATVVAGLLQTKRDREDKRWEMKREVCKRALDLVDAVFANRSWSDPSGAPLKISPQDRPSIRELRQCLNDLCVVCENPQVVSCFRKCLDVGQQHGRGRADDIVDLRNAIRAELGYGKPVDVDREAAFLAVIDGTVESAPPEGEGGHPRT